MLVFIAENLIIHVCNTRI